MQEIVRQSHIPARHRLEGCHRRLAARGESPTGQVAGAVGPEC